jgi:hypothetical protein
VVEDRVVHRRHALEDRDAVAGHQLERPPGVEAGHQVQACAGAHGRVHRARLAERVKQRQRAEQHVVLAEPCQTVRRYLDVPAQVGVRQLGALRLPGCPGRVEDHRRVAGRPFRDGGVRLDLGRNGFVVPGPDERHLGARRAGAFLGGSRELVPCEQ